MRPTIFPLQRPRPAEFHFAASSKAKAIERVRQLHDKVSRATAERVGRKRRRHPSKAAHLEVFEWIAKADPEPRIIKVLMRISGQKVEEGAWPRQPADASADRNAPIRAQQHIDSSLIYNLR